MKHLIKIESVAHGVLGVRHAGNDGQYCEAGETVVVNWQPDAGWGLKEAYYKDAGGNVTPISLIPTKINGKDVVTFTMPDANIVVGGVFKRFVIEDWTGKGSAFSIVGSFPTDKLPILDGFKDAGKIAFDETKKAYVHWDGYGWATADGKPNTPRYLKFTAVDGHGEIGFLAFNEGYELPEDYEAPIIEYSTDDGMTWNPYEVEVSETEKTENTILIEKGESVLFRGVNDNLSYYLEDEDDYVYFRAYILGIIAASGDVTALLNGVGGDVALSEYCYDNMFSGCTGLTAAPALPATTLAEYCYASMFSGCTGLTAAPALPATTLAEYCYDNMFSGCTGLTAAPALPATTLASNCYVSMFNGCTGLTAAPALTATTLASNCYASMFSGCTGLTAAPALTATTLASNCYASMFSGCTGLTAAPALPATTLASNCYVSMFSGCTGLTAAPALPATTLASNCYASMFSGCTGLTAAPALPATTLASNCYASMFSGCTGLTAAPALTATTLAEYCYDNMFSGCTGITSHDVATLNNSTNVFYNNSSCASLTVDSETPPTIGSSTITGLKADCTIYVPAASVDAYKAAQYWSARAAYIQAIP